MDQIQEHVLSEQNVRKYINLVMEQAQPSPKPSRVLMKQP